jgi:hypothetical protein
MAKRNIADDKGGPGDRVGKASRANKAKSIKQERKQVVEDYIESLREFAKSLLRKMN